MASKKLTNKIRDQILAKIIEGAFPEEHAKVDQLRRDLSLRFYRLIVTEQQEKQMRALPADFFHSLSGRSSRKLCYQSGSTNTYTYFEMDFGTKGLPTPAWAANTYAEVFDKQLYKDFQDLEDKIGKLNSAIAEIREGARAVVYAATTFAKLVEMWPAAEQFLPKEPVKTEEHLPVVNCEKLNKLLAIAKPQVFEAVAA